MHNIENLFILNYTIEEKITSQKVEVILKNIAILGSSGSIGQSTLKIVKNSQGLFQVKALAAHSNVEVLEKQIKEFSPEIIAMFDEKSAKTLESRIGKKVLFGMEGLKEVATHVAVDTVVSAISGVAGLVPTVAAIEARKNIALANKEVLVSAGSLVMPLVKEKGVKLLPIDSEHSAIFQCLEGSQSKDIERLILTASGGPFREFSKTELCKITAKEALFHPNYKMGSKNTIDSSTLMNKGLELIEAHFLFNVLEEKIEVVIHPSQIIHSMVEFVDGSILAQMSEPTMEIPIQYALSYPKRLKLLKRKLFDFTQKRELLFLPPNTQNFPCLRLAREALKIGGSLLPFMNGANEILVRRFLQGEIRWIDIGEKLEKLMSSHRVENVLTLEAVLAIEGQAKEAALRI